MEKFHVGDAASVRPGTEVGPWRVVSRKGQGSYGVIYLVEPVGQAGAKPAALKLALHAGDERFEREVELLSRLNHPNVPRLLDSGTWTSPEGTSVPFLVMEWVFDHAWCVSSQVSFSGVRVVGRRRSCCSRSLRRRVSSLRSA